MKTLYLVRHAKAEDLQRLHDSERRLTDTGIRQAEKMSKILSEQIIFPDLFISSPAKRALETARIFAENLSYPENEIVTDRKIYDASAIRLLQIINGIDNKTTTVFVFGHNPGLSLIAEYLSGFDRWLRKCAVARIVFDYDDWADVSENSGICKIFEPKDI